MRILLLIILLQAASLGAAETRVHRWVDADGVTHFSDSPPVEMIPFATTTLVTEAGRTPTPRPVRQSEAPQPPRRAIWDNGAAEARCAAWLDELRAITDRRRRGHTASESARLRERSSDLNRMRQRRC